MKTAIDAQKPEHTSTFMRGSKNSPFLYLLDVCVLLIMGALMFYGCSWNFFRTHTDVARYECYAVAFWKGMPALNAFPPDQCAPIVHPEVKPFSNTAIAASLQRHKFPGRLTRFIAAQNATQPFHALPREYPLLTIIPFSLALVAPAYWYQVAFALVMILVAAFVYALLARYRSRKAAIAFAFYIVVGGWGTAAGRFDLVPSALTLIAVLYAVRSKWNWAFAFLALATLFKFYPLVLLLPFLLAQQMQSREKWTSWRRLLPLGSFVIVCVVVMGVSLALSVEGTLGPFSYFENRPIQVESAAASLLWICSVLGYHLNFVHTYGSLNVITPVDIVASLLVTVLLVLGLGYTYWLQWRGKLDLATSTLLTLLIVMFTGKVFSPQYLIWVAPLVAYVGESDWRWLLSWGLLSALTTYIYPHLYLETTDLIRVPLLPLFFPSTTARNLLLLLFVVALLRYATRRGPASLAATSANTNTTQVVA